MSEIRFNDRTLVLGYTGSGKSELINVLFRGIAGGTQRLLFDSKPEFSLPGVEPVSDAAEIDWSQPLIHYRCSAPSAREVGRLFQVLAQRRRLLVCVHELSDLCEYNAGKAPASVNAYLSKGRVFGLGLIGGTQRPVNVPKRAFTDADHVFIFASGFPEQADLAAAAAAAGLSSADLAGKLAALHDAHGPHAFLHCDRRDRRVMACTPLEPAERSGIIVERPTLY